MEPLGFHDQSDVLPQTPDALTNFKLLKGIYGSFVISGAVVWTKGFVIIG